MIEPPWHESILSIKHWVSPLWFWALFSHVSATLKLISQWDVLTFNYSWCFIVGQTLHRHIGEMGKRDHLTVEFWSLQRNLNYKVAIGGVTSDLDTVLFPYTQDQFHQRKWWWWWELGVSCARGAVESKTIHFWVPTFKWVRTRMCYHLSCLDGRVL